MTKSLPITLSTEALNPDQLPSMHELMHWSTRLTNAAIAAGTAIGIALLAHYMLFALLRSIGRKSEHRTESVAAAQLYHAVRWAMVASAMGFAEEVDKLVAHAWNAVERFVVPALMGWVIYALMKTFAELLAQRADNVEDQLAARSRRTRITLLSRAAGFIIIFITISLILLGIPGVRHVGATLMASAGIVGLAVGAAAQPALKSLIAGLQIALTEPIRIGDFVVVEGESGRVEDIRLSYVVIRTGDERRLIVPMAKFLDASFQNWTRVGGITGSVVVPIRPGFPIAPIRAAYEDMLAQRPEWDKRNGQLLVSEARVGSVELKLVMSAGDPNDLSNLRIFVREAMLEWLRTEMPDALCASTTP